MACRKHELDPPGLCGRVPPACAPPPAVVVVEMVPVAVVDPMFATAGVAGLLPQAAASNAKPANAAAQGVKPTTRRSRAFELVGRLTGMSILPCPSERTSVPKR